MGRPRKCPIAPARCGRCKKPIYAGDRVAKVLEGKLSADGDAEKTEGIGIFHLDCLRLLVWPGKVALEDAARLKAENDARQSQPQGKPAAGAGAPDKRTTGQG